ncbi:LacI family DNA-binding transcriptional regulator [Demequina maris]|uniref:LacI family DNA-binding transcriptional regulator n=1 Tax=Demequina maris TaxID=1638982 RepID=UPI0009E530FC|nr:LacI family DNA-binding transcriptional regulator [Demequina maris]
MTRVTAADVAAEAGVSRSTVSYVLNGSDRVRFPAATVERVLEAAARLNYTPNAAASSLRRGRSDVVLAVLQDMPQGTALGRLLDELTAAVAAHGQSLVTWAAREGSALADVLRDLTPRLIVELMPFGDEDRATAAGSGVPVLSAIDALLDLESHVGATQVDHLVGLGHRRIGVVTVDEPRVEVFARARRASAADALRRHGLAAPPMAVMSEAGAAAADVLAESLREWTRGPDPVTAVACYNDLFAAITCAAAERAGLSVPRDLAVVGVDDEPLGAWLSPTLTTVRVDLPALATAIAAALAGDARSRDVEVIGEGRDVALVVRGTSGAPRSGSVA